ncbi:translation initiation factor IF-3 [Candidatus Acetothermia bacterium]|nr:translation initiation factor IF-3 [Candidatus Acetothermia bacterium]
MDNNQVGVMPLAQAIAEARRRGQDLVEVAPQANPVVCRIIDFGKYRYRQEKREKKVQRARRLKEIRMTIQIEKHDFETKIRHIREFLEKDSKVRVTVNFRGREIVHMDRGRELLDRITKAVAGVGKVDQEAKERGRNLQMLLVPSSGKGGQATEEEFVEEMQAEKGEEIHAQEESTQGPS